MQLFTIHGYRRGHYVPLVFWILPSKAGKITCMFRSIKEQCAAQFNLHFSPEEIVSDFELAIQNAVHLVWPMADIIGCRFHLGQVWWRAVQRYCLVEEHKNANSELGKWIKASFGLTFLAPQEVENCFISV